jgi:hypothetical protein
VINDAREMLAERLDEFLTLHTGLLHEVPDGVFAKGGFELLGRDGTVRPAANPGARDLALTVLLQIPDGVVDPAPQHRARDRTAAKNRASWRPGG